MSEFSAALLLECWYSASVYSRTKSRSEFVYSLICYAMADLQMMKRHTMWQIPEELSE